MGITDLNGRAAFVALTSLCLMIGGGWVFASLTQPVYASAEAGKEIIGHSETGEKHVHGSHVECPLPKSTMDVLRCARDFHPAAARAKLNRKAAESLPEVARQVRNPELDFESNFGRGDSAGSSVVEVGILQPIELGGKRSSRIQVAEATQDQIRADSTDVEAQVIISTVLSLHRLRQIGIERKAIESTVDTLTTIIRQQRARPTLGPEQQASLSVYRMALADAQIRASEIYDEERGLEHFFYASTGHSLSEIEKVLPVIPEEWPNIPDEFGGRAPSPAILQALAAQKLAMAELGESRSTSWPEIKLGPNFEFEEGGPNSEQYVGFRLMMDLPVFQINGAGRTHARKNLERADEFLKLATAEENHERAEQLRVYRSAVRTLKDVPKLSEIEREHKRNEALGRKGLISGALLIESHRHRNDLVKSRNARELKAIDALWNLHKLDGRIFKETI